MPSNDAMNKTPKQKARGQMDAMLAAGWAVQDKAAIDSWADRDVAMRENPTDIRPTEDAK